MMIFNCVPTTRVGHGHLRHRDDHGYHYWRDLRTQNRRVIDYSLLPDYLCTPEMGWQVQESL